jgi:hypothetical protein
VVLAPTSLSVTCHAFAGFLRTALAATDHSIDVVIGTPADAAKKDELTLNLLFYRFEPWAFDSDVRPDEPWMIRLYCLITAFGKEVDEISQSEHELRMLGEVMRIFHETPVLPVIDVLGEQTRLQVVFHPLSSDELNHLWSAQEATSLQSSIAYELAVGPIVPSTRRVEAALAGEFGVHVAPTMEIPTGEFVGRMEKPQVVLQTVDTTRENWAPIICLVQEGECLLMTSMAAGSAEAAAFNPEVWVAGETMSDVTLRWNAWTTDAGWREEGPTKDTKPVGEVMDPEGGPPEGAVLPTMALPFTDQAGQAVLTATRTYTSGVDGAQRSVHSNQVLVVLY